MMKTIIKIISVFLLLVFLGGIASATCPYAEKNKAVKTGSGCNLAAASGSSCSKCTADTAAKVTTSTCNKKKVSTCSKAVTSAKSTCPKIKTCSKNKVKPCQKTKFNKCNYSCSKNGSSCAGIIPNTTIENISVVTNGAGIVSYHPCKNNICEVGADGTKLTLVNYNNSTNCTYAELITFLEEDQTDQIPYSDEWVCADAATRLHNNAEAAGIKCAWVGCSFTSGIGHAFNEFSTIDQGTVFVDCSGVPYPTGQRLDKILFAVEGQQLSGIYLDDGGSTGSMGLIKSMIVFW